MKDKAYCNRKVKVFSYARWSSDAQSDGDSDRPPTSSGRSLVPSTRSFLRRSRKGEGVSGKAGRNRAEGSGLSKLLKVAQEGDYLLVEDLDRVSRENWLTAMNFLGDIVSKGVKVVTLANGNEIDSERRAKLRKGR